MDAQIALGLAGSGYGALLAVSLRRSVADRLLAALILIAAVCAALIAFNQPWLEPVEVGLAFLAGPVFLAYATGRAVPRWQVGLAILLGASSVVAPFDPMRVAMLHQIAFTIAAIVRGRREWLPMVVTAMMVAIHIGQVIRTLSGVRMMPMVIGAGFVWLGAAAWHRLNVPPAPRYARSGIDDDDVEAAVARLRVLMAERHPHRDPELTLAALAQRAGLSPHHLSQVLNERLQTSFADLVNRARVDDVCELLVRPESERLTLEAVAREAGFNSRSAFYQAFRKFRGMTPSQYRAGILS